MPAWGMETKQQHKHDSDIYISRDLLNTLLAQPLLALFYLQHRRKLVLLCLRQTARPVHLEPDDKIALQGRGVLVRHALAHHHLLVARSDNIADINLQVSA